MTLVVLPQEKIPIARVPNKERSTNNSSRIKSIANNVRASKWLLDVDDAYIRQSVSNLGDAHPEGDKIRIKSREVSQSQFSSWVAGRYPIPDWRLAEFVVVFELTLLERLKQCRDLGLTEDDPEMKASTGAEKPIGHLRDLPEVQPFLMMFRKNLLGRFQREANRSKADKDRYQRYAEFLKRFNK